jgi:CHAP domain
MSVETVMARITQLQQGLLPQTDPSTTGTSSSTAFASTLQDATSSAGVTGASGTAATGTSFSSGVSGATTATDTTGQTAGQRALQVAEGEIGQTEQPPGSNDSPRIAEYRTATAGSGIGPWCSYFVSWAAKQAGAPVGEAGQGFGSVSALSSWAQRTGRFTPAAAGQAPQPGDLIVWGGEHVGMVESVDADGKIHTVEGNSSNMVTRRTHDATGDGATGYIRLG